jgi:hypothetical protein
VPNEYDDHVTHVQYDDHVIVDNDYNYIEGLSRRRRSANLTRRRRSTGRELDTCIEDVAKGGSSNGPRFDTPVGPRTCQDLDNVLNCFQTHNSCESDEVHYIVAFAQQKDCRITHCQELGALRERQESISTANHRDRR